MRTFLVLAIAAACALPARAQQAAPATPKAAPAKAPPPSTPPTTAAQSLDRQLGIVEADLVPLVEAMPADKFDFTPTGEGFTGVRSFKGQVGHAAGTLLEVAGALLGEAPALSEADLQAGPARLKTKEDFVAYLKDGFARAHKAIATVNDKNLLEVVGSKNGIRGTRLGLSNLLTWHSFDHYGQLVVYARMNGIVPPASRGQ